MNGWHVLEHQETEKPRCHLHATAGNQIRDRLLGRLQGEIENQAC